MGNENHFKVMGARIFSELNDLKRTPEAAARDLGIEFDELDDVIKGNASMERVYGVIGKMGQVYPIDSSDLMVPEDDTTNGVRIMRAEEAEKTKRIFERDDRTGGKTPYYDYRDSAMSRLAPLKPEWIRELRVVGDNNPNNPDVAYNNGHFMHQITFFKGPVNFYWEDKNGERHCAEMNTGDSNYITPFHRHSFTSRSQDKEALILAVTFGGEARRAQKELYALGERVVEDVPDYRDQHKAIGQLLDWHMNNGKVSVKNLRVRLGEGGREIDLEGVLSGQAPLTPHDRNSLARVLGIEPSDLMIPQYNPDEEVVVRQRGEGYSYPGGTERHYEIRELARTSKMPMMKGFDIRPLRPSVDLLNGFQSSLHGWGYNYGDADIGLAWEIGGEEYGKTLKPGDSFYMQPYIQHGFSDIDGQGNAEIVTIGVSGALNLATQRELAYFTDPKRAVRETRQWFD
ncbi:hypothetical protein CMI47_15325 [Candidatus Pacearchaeota archaeon]|nr:hypothetical protein [Candidatus Pacearchaeota archaeon]|tara:strand:+ start:11076 stop:12446 length:1371 start_codon:yes stop_codon:yes gene_type:complete